MHTAVTVSFVLAALAAAQSPQTGAPIATGTTRQVSIEAIAIPGLVSFQGRLLDSMDIPVPDTVYSVRFRLYTQGSGGTHYWEETRQVRTEEGLFAVQLGSVTAVPYVPENGNLYLGMKVGSDPEMEPRVRIVSSAYAFLSRKADTADYVASARPSGAAGGDLAGSYPNPTVDGLRGRAVSANAPGTGQVLKWTGSQWAPRDDSAGGGDNAWTRGSPDSVLFTVHRLGIARGGTDNALLGTQHHTHVNLGSIACTTGMSGQNYVNCTVAGGGWNVAAGNGAFIGAGTSNRLVGTNAVLVGGERNEINGNHAALLGGSDNTAAGNWSVIAGGSSNRTSDFHTTVSGGVLNVAGARFAAVGGGDMDSAMAFASGVFSGYRNTAGDQGSDSFAMVGGGRYNKATGKAGFVGGGEYNTASGPQATVAGGNGGTAGGVSSGALSGYGNTGGDAVADTAAVVVGGWDNTAADRYCFVGGGRENLSFGYRAVVAGGSYNSSYNLGAVSGGSQNQAATQGAVPGGYQDTVLGMNGFAAGWHSKVNSGHSNAAAFTGSHTTASDQIRAQAFSTGSGMFSIDHPEEPLGRILNQYAVGSSEMVLMYRGTAKVGASGRVEVQLPGYFADVNRDPMVQLTGVGTHEVYVAEEVTGNRFSIGGPPGTRVYWTVTGERKDQTAEIARLLTPVEQEKTGDLAGHSLDDDCLAASYDELERMGAASAMSFRTPEGRRQARDGDRADEK